MYTSRTLTRRVATCTQSTQLRTHCHSREHFMLLHFATKLIHLISDEGCDCSISWHYSVNAAEKSIAIQNMRVQRFDRAAKDDNGS